MCIRDRHNIDKVDANNVLAACGENEVLNMIAKAKMEDNPRVQHLMDCLLYTSRCV